MRVISYFIIFVLAFLRVTEGSYVGLQRVTMLHMSQNAFRYSSQPVTCTEMRLDTDSLYRRKSGSRHVHVEEQDNVCLVAPNNVLFTGIEN